jgi:hypothetical protein
MTPEQRAEYQAAALATRSARANLKAALKRGELTLAEALDHDLAAKMKVSALLASLPKMGKVTAAKVMERIGIAENRRVAGLGERQRAVLKREFADA